MKIIIKIPKTFSVIFNALNKNHNYNVCIYENKKEIDNSKTHGWNFDYYKSKKDFEKYGYFLYNGNTEKSEKIIRQKIIKIKIPGIFNNIFNALNRNYNFNISVYEHKNEILKEKSVYGWSFDFKKSKKDFEKYGHFSFNGNGNNKQSEQFLKIITLYII